MGASPGLCQQTHNGREDAQRGDESAQTIPRPGRMARLAALPRGARDATRVSQRGLTRRHPKKNGPTHTKQVGPSPLDKPMILRTFVDSEPTIDIGASDRETAAQGRHAGGWYSVPK